MNEEIRTLNHFEEAGFDGGQSKAMVIGIDDLLVKSMATFREHFDHRFSALESSVRSLQNFQIVGLISVVAAMLFGFAGLTFAILSQS